MQHFYKFIQFYIFFCVRQIIFSINFLLEKDKEAAETAIHEKELKIIEEQGNEINLLKKEMNSKTLDAKEVFKKNIQSVVEIFAFLTDENLIITGDRNGTVF